MSRNEGRMGKETKAKQLTYQDKHCYFTEEKLFHCRNVKKRNDLHACSSDNDQSCIELFLKCYAVKTSQLNFP